MKKDDEETVPVAPGDKVMFEWKVDATTPYAVWYPQVRYLCSGDFSEYVPDNGFCAVSPGRGLDEIGSFRTRIIEVRTLTRVRGPLVALMFVAPLFLAFYFLKDFVFKA